MAFKAGSIYVDADLKDEKFNKGLSGLGKTAKRAGAALGAAIAAGFTVAIVKADQFQQSMSNVATVIDTSAVSTQDLTKEILQLDPALGSTTELTNGLYQAFSAGAESAEQAMQITTDSAIFATAALTDTATAVDVLTTASNAYGSEVVSSTQAADIFFTTIKEGKITGEQLAGSIGQSIPLYASMGIELEQLGAGMATMTKQGISANEATTQLNAVVNAFISPSEALSEALADIGVESGAAFIEAKGLSGALGFLEDQTGGNTDELGKLLPNIRAMKGAMALTGQGGEIFADVMSEMETSAGAATEAFDKQETTTKAMKNSFDRLFVVAGNVGKTFTDKLAKGATDAATGMLTFLVAGSGAEVFSKIIGGMAAGFEGIKTAVTPLVEVLGTELKEIWDTLKTQLTEIVGETDMAQAGFNVLGVAVQVLSAGVAIVSQGIQGAISIMGAWVVALKETGKTIGLLFQLMTRKSTWDDVQNQFVTTGEAFKDLGGAYVDTYVDLFRTTVEEVKEFGGSAREIASEISTTVTTTYDDMSSSVQTNWAEMVTGQGSAAQDIIDAVLNMNDTITTDTDDAGGQVKKTWQDNLKETFDNASSWGGAFGGLFADVMSGILDIQSRSLDLQIEAQEANYKKREDNLKALLDDGTITQAEYDEQFIELEKAKNAELNRLGKKKFDNDKKRQIGQVWINAAGAIASGWAAAFQLGPIGGLIFGIANTVAMVAMAGIQTAQIAKQQYVPQYARGGTHTGGLAMTDEQGPEIKYLPDGTKIIPSQLSREIMGGGGGGDIIVNMSDFSVRNEDDIELLAEEVSQRLGDRLREESA